jgi:hypothetical protein
MLTSSPGLIVLARAELDRGPEVPLAGEIDALGGLADLLAFIQQSRWSGTLHTVDGNAYRAVWFKNGEVRTTGSNLPADRLGEILYRYGRVARADLDRALESAGPEQRIGQALMDLGKVSSHDVFTFVRKQVEEVFYAVLRLRTGSYYFERNSDQERLPDLALSTQKLLLEGMRRIDELNRFAESIPNDDCVPFRSEGGPESPADATLCAVLALVDGRRTVAEIGRLSRLGVFEATRALYQLVQAGAIRIRQEIDPIPSARPAPSRQVDLARLLEIVNELLARIQGLLAQANKGERFRADLGAFFRGATAYSALFREIEPDATGRLPGDKIIANLGRAGVSDPAEYLQAALNELLCFLVFTAGDSIGQQQLLGQHLTQALHNLERQPRS